MSTRLKAVFQYTFILALVAFLIWFSLRNLTVSGGDGSYSSKLNYLFKTWQSANKGWLIAMAFLAILSHVIRAIRWRMLMEPSGYKPKLSSSFLSLMVGYLVNLVVPRGGEISRCYNLYKLEKTPVEISFGTVVIERLVDVVCLLILLLISFFVESEKLFLFIKELPIGTGESRLQIFFYLGLGFIFIALICYYLYKKNKKINAFVVRTWIGFKEGLLSVFKLQRKGLFIFYSLLIWFLYFAMSYTVIMAFPETSHLGIGAVLSLFAIGSIAMAVPLPGGTGSYHVLVPQGLVFLYHIPQSDAVAFVFIFHGWQTAILILGGAISLLVTSFLVKKT